MSRRFCVVRVVVLGMFALLAARLWQVQVIHGGDYRRASDENRIRLICREAPRGVIYDRCGRVLAASRMRFDVMVVPEEFQAQPGALEQLAQILETTPGRLAARLKAQQGGRAAVSAAQDVSFRIAVRVAEAALHIRGLRLQTQPLRRYPRGRLAAHVLGYVREISAEELRRAADYGYAPGDRIGKQGVEHTLEASLRGADGGEQVEVDATGRLVRVLGQVAPVAGASVVLNLDAQVQQAAEQGLRGRRGAAVALDARTGEVLALASAPDFDPNILCGRISSAQWRYLSGPGRPQHNRALSAVYEPGSVFKLVTAAAALEEGRATLHSRFFCPGYYRLGEWRFHCWQRAGHGSLDFVRGMAQSCNVMFIRLGRAVGRERLERWAHAFGLGARTGIDAPGESSGLVPDPHWKRQRLGLPWYPGDTCQMAVGQGGLLVTPLQAAVATAAVANGGYLVTPRIVRAVGDTRLAAPPARPVGISSATARALRRGMAAVVRQGTARRIWDPRFPIAGKTGTAQNPHGPAHAWFVGFAPVENPRVAVAVLIEQGGKGSAAAPIGAAILRAALRASDERAVAVATLP